MNVQPAAPGARGFFPTIIRAWALILIVAIAFGLAALGYLWWRDPVYRATATLYVTSGSDPNPSSWDTVRGAKERAPTYASLAYTDAVIAPAVEAAGLNMPVDVARAAIQVEINSQITMMTVSATDADPLIAQRLAGGVADSLADAVATLEVPGGGGVPVARLTVVNTATVEENLFFPKPWITVLVASGVGLIVGLLLALIWERLNNRARDERDAEVALDSRTLATIPAEGSPMVWWTSIRVTATPHPRSARFGRRWLQQLMSRPPANYWSPARGRVRARRQWPSTWPRHWRGPAIRSCSWMPT